MRKGDKVKVSLARRLRRDMTMSLKWIARRLHMGSWTYVSNPLHEKREDLTCGKSENTRMHHLHAVNMKKYLCYSIFTLLSASSFWSQGA